MWLLFLFLVTFDKTTHSLITTAIVQKISIALCRIFVFFSMYSKIITSVHPKLKYFGHSKHDSLERAAAEGIVSKNSAGADQHDIEH